MLSIEKYQQELCQGKDTGKHDKGKNIFTYSNKKIWQAKQGTYRHIRIWWCDALLRYIVISLYSDRVMYPERGNDSEKMQKRNSPWSPKMRFRFSRSSPKMRLPPISDNADTLLDSFHAILGHPRAKIIASRLHYLIFLMRIITSDKTSHRYLRVSSLNKHSIASLTAQRRDTRWHSTAHSIGTRHEPKKSLFIWQADATPPLPHAPMRNSSQRGNPSPHKNSIFLCPYFSLDRCSVSLCPMLSYALCYSHE